MRGMIVKDGKIANIIEVENESDLAKFGAIPHTDEADIGATMNQDIGKWEKQAPPAPAPSPVEQRFADLEARIATLEAAMTQGG
jgi:hypothetical protein